MTNRVRMAITTTLRLRKVTNKAAGGQPAANVGIRPLRTWMEADPQAILRAGCETVSPVSYPRTRACCLNPSAMVSDRVSPNSRKLRGRIPPPARAAGGMVSDARVGEVA